MGWKFVYHRIWSFWDDVNVVLDPIGELQMDMKTEFTEELLDS